MTIQPASVELPDAQHDLVAALNDTAAPTPSGNLAGNVARALDAHPERTAVIAPGRTLSYGDVAVHAAHLERRLAAAGIEPGSRVVLATEHGWEQLVGSLAILRAGGVYLPVAPDLPQTVRWQVARRAGASAVLTQWWLTDRLAWPRDLAVLAPDEEPATVAPAPVQLADDAPAALLPYGPDRVPAPVSHRALLDAATDVNRRLGLGADDRLLALAPAGSAVASYEMFGPLLAGAAVVYCVDVDVHHPRAWLEQLRRQGVTIWITTSARLTLLLDELAATGEPLPDSLRAVVITGDRLDPRHVAELRSRVGRELRVAYATSLLPGQPWVAWSELTELGEHWRSVPIGRPMANQRLFVLSTASAPCPTWVTGRLHLGGAAAAGRETGEPSVVHPETGEPLLATDVSARLLPEGVIEVVGEGSSQVTVHGRPLNVRDAEVALGAHEAVRDAVVVTWPDSAETVAFVRPRPRAEVSAEALADHLRRKVSPYLIPARIELRDALPLTPDGCVDRAALREAATPWVAAPAGPPARPVTSGALPGAPGEDATRAGEQELIRRVTALACRLFDVTEIDPHTNLLDIGATSYQLVRLATVVEEELGVEVDVDELLRFPSVAVIVGAHLGRNHEPAPTAAAGGGPARGADPAQPGGDRAPVVDAASTTPTVLSRIQDRQAFREAGHGIRRDLDARPAVPLAPAARPAPAFRTVRRFDSRPVDLDLLGTLLQALQVTSSAGRPTRRYPSAGGSYAVGAYVLVAPGRVRSLATGSYYYHPVHHRLVPVAVDVVLPASAHAEPNRVAFRQSAFSLYLVARMPAITPLYGDLAWDFTVFEAGAMTQLLGAAAEECGLGLCPVGAMDPTPLSELLALERDDRFVHALLCGVPEGAPA
ncbi:AMP-binding protein [Micromonospora okii]|uniref:AMP-binding protein n=1 Tax=Micromonospora okii TaxID=1182970 RepID=UPI001E4C9869|nr:AMP-binding protein [Micromonospora okii]